jgi:hypothetical protein
MPPDLLKAIRRLTKGVSVDLDEELEGDVAI